MIKWFERHSRISWGVTFIIAATMFYLSSRTFDGVPGPPGFLGYIYHFSSYFFLGAFLMLSVVKGKYQKLALPCALAGIIFGVTDEIHQLFVPGRACDIHDLGLDSLGIGFAFLVYLITLEYRKG
jgi:VanZ family protein